MQQHHGPRLVDHMFALIAASGRTQEDLRAEFGFGITWLPDVKAGRVKSPNVDLVQRIIEGLSGEPLISKPAGTMEQPGGLEQAERHAAPTSPAYSGPAAAAIR